LAVWGIGIWLRKWYNEERNNVKRG